MSLRAGSSARRGRDQSVFLDISEPVALPNLSNQPGLLGFGKALMSGEELSY